MTSLRVGTPLIEPGSVGINRVGDYPTPPYNAAHVAEQTGQLCGRHMHNYRHGGDYVEAGIPEREPPGQFVVQEVVGELRMVARRLAEHRQAPVDSGHVVALGKVKRGVSPAATAEIKKASRIRCVFEKMGNYRAKVDGLVRFHNRGTFRVVVVEGLSHYAEKRSTPSGIKGGVASPSSRTRGAERGSPSTVILTTVAQALILCRVVPPDTDNASLRRELEFRKALVTLTNELLASTLSPSFYQAALDRTVELVPDAQGGSVLLRHEDGLYHFEAAVEFDFDILQQLTLSDEEMGQSRDRTSIKKIEIQDYESRMPSEKVQSFRDAGKLNEIRATLSVPLKMENDTVGFFNLDNFERSDAFNGTDVGIAEAIAAQVSLALHRLSLERKLQEEREKFQHLALHDALTDLPNRRLFFDSLSRAVAQAARSGSRLGLVYVDLDGFKQINDNYGHDIGDEVLNCTARRLRDTIRKGDIAARLGGDEFGVILMDLNRPSDGLKVAEKLRRFLEAEIEVRGTTVPVAASVGLATYPENGETLEQLIKPADWEMYQSKRR